MRAQANINMDGNENGSAIQSCTCIKWAFYLWNDDLCFHIHVSVQGDTSSIKTDFGSNAVMDAEFPRKNVSQWISIPRNYFEFVGPTNPIDYSMNKHQLFVENSLEKFYITLCVLLGIEEV